MGKVLIAGGTGFIGSAVVRTLRDEGKEVLVLSRSTGPGRIVWDGRTVGEWAKELEGAEAVVNLAGKPIASRWTEENKAEIVSSRVEPTVALGKAIASCPLPPKVWVNGSAIGIYGNRGDEVITEESAPGPKDNFLVKSCLQWEEAAKRVQIPSTKQAILRIGFVLGKSGGALPLLVRLSKSFLGGPVGSGKQFVSWVHVEDVAAMIAWLIKGQLEGIFNAVSPNPARNKDLMAGIGKVVGRPSWPPAPALAVKLFGAVSGTPPQLALDGQNVLPKRALDAGFGFRFPTLAEALADTV